MHVPKLRWLLPIACCLLSAPASAWQGSDSAPKRIFVEPFTTKTDAEGLRSDVTAELRKLSSVSVVPDEGKADLILGGGGEIWITGYRSFSPRSHMKMPTNGTPIYGGYLSVELKNRQGTTVWSYLAAPDAAAQDVSQDIAKRVAKHLVEALTDSETPAAAP